MRNSWSQHCDGRHKGHCGTTCSIHNDGVIHELVCHFRVNIGLEHTDWRHTAYLGPLTLYIMMALSMNTCGILGSMLWLRHCTPRINSVKSHLEWIYLFEHDPHTKDPGEWIKERVSKNTTYEEHGYEIFCSGNIYIYYLLTCVFRITCPLIWPTHHDIFEEQEFSALFSIRGNNCNGWLSSVSPIKSEDFGQEWCFFSFAGYLPETQTLLGT